MEDIKVKLARIDEKFEALCNDESNQYSWEAMQEGLIQARQITVAEHLREMEALGMACPSVEEVVSWMGVYIPPEIAQFAKTLDELSDEQARVILGVAEQAMAIAEEHGEEAAVAFLNDLHAEVEHIAAADSVITKDQLNALLREAAEVDMEASGTACDPAMYEGLLVDDPEKYMGSAGGIPVHDYGADRRVMQVDLGNEAPSQETLDKLVSQFNDVYPIEVDGVGSNGFNDQVVSQFEFSNVIAKPLSADELIGYIRRNFPDAEITRKYGAQACTRFGGLPVGDTLTIKIQLPA